MLNCAPQHHYGNINGSLKIARWYLKWARMQPLKLQNGSD
jgi:hypothetical protein